MNYAIGTRVERKDNHYYVKSRGHGLIKEARLIAILRDGELASYQRVFFRDGDRHNLKPENIVPISFKQFKYRHLPTAQVIYIPKERKSNEQSSRKVRVG